MPEWKASVGAQYTVNLGNAGSITPRVDVSYLASQYTNANNRSTNFIDEYTLVNARISWADSEDKWEASLEGTNLGGKYYFLTRFDQQSAVGHTDGQPGRPREWALTLKRKF